MEGCVVIMAGGTGGHVFPALAVAGELRQRGLKVVWIGTRTGLEADVVPKAGIPMEWISVTGLRGKGALDWLWAPWRLSTALWQALNVMRKHKPRCVLGMGGFVAGPGGVAARLAGVPLVIHEQNAIAGVTNRLLARIATRVIEAFPRTFAPGRKVMTMGNPVRAEIAALPVPELRWRERSGPLRLLVVGGSLGARALNDAVPAAVRELASEARPQIWHQTGARNIDEARGFYAKAGVDARVVPFIDNMAEAYGWADLVLCRAGALTIAELAAAGVGSVLVPYPFAVDDHQRFNAQFLVGADAAQMILQKDVTASRLRELLESFGCADSAQQPAALARGRERLLAMARAARALALPDAARAVADVCLEVSHD